MQVISEQTKKVLKEWFDPAEVDDATLGIAVFLMVIVILVLPNLAH